MQISRATELQQHSRSCRAFMKLTFKKRHDPISNIYKEYKILKFADIVNSQNCLFIYQVQKYPKLTVSFPALQAREKHNYSNRSVLQNLFDVLLKTTRMNDLIKPVKYQCIRDWDNFKKAFPQIPESEFSRWNIKSYLKQKCFDQYLKISKSIWRSILKIYQLLVTTENIPPKHQSSVFLLVLLDIFPHPHIAPMCLIF